MNLFVSSETVTSLEESSDDNGTYHLTGASPSTARPTFVLTIFLIIFMFSLLSFFLVVITVRRMALARVHAPLTEAQCLIISSFNNCTTFVLIVFFYMLCRMKLLWAGGQCP